MASRGRGARQKGFQFERDIARVFSDATLEEFKRGLGQTRGGGGEVPDVVPSKKALADKLHIECKRQKVCSIKGAMKQAKEDIEKRKASNPDINPVPIVITKDDRKDTLVTMELDDFIELFSAWYFEYAPRGLSETI